MLRFALGVTWGALLAHWFPDMPTTIALVAVVVAVVVWAYTKEV